MSEQDKKQDIKPLSDLSPFFLTIALLGMLCSGWLLWGDWKHFHTPEFVSSDFIAHLVALALSLGCLAYAVIQMRKIEKPKRA